MTDELIDRNKKNIMYCNLNEILIDTELISIVHKLNFTILQVFNKVTNK